jgi:hypothetical protein
MKYEVIEHEKLSGADFAAIIKFDSYPDALAAVKAINESDETNTPGSASVGNTGAVRVGKYVVFNAYSQACYDKFLKIVGSIESPAEPRESSVDSLARTLWDGMADGDCEVIDDRDAAIAYLCAMFPGAKATIISLESCFYFDYDGMEYGVTLDYDRDENNELRGEKIIVSDCNDKMKPVTIDRDTSDVKGTLEKFFKKAKSAGDSPDSPDEPSLTDRVAKLEAIVKTLNAEIRKIKKIIKK